MQKISLVLSLILSLAIVSVSAQTTKSTNSGSDTQKSIQERLNQYANAIVNNDYATLDNFYTNDAISMPNYGKMMTGKNAIHRENMKMGKNEMKINSLDLNVTKIINEKGDIANAIGTFTISITGKNNKMMKDEGSFMSVLTKQGGEWKIMAEIWNSSNNPWMGKDMDGNQKMNNMQDSTGADKSGQ